MKENKINKIVNKPPTGVENLCVALIFGYTNLPMRSADEKKDAIIEIFVLWIFFIM